MKPQNRCRRRSRTLAAILGRIGCGLLCALSACIIAEECAWANGVHQRVVVLSHDPQAGSLESSFVSALRTYLSELGLELDVRPTPASTSPFDMVAQLRASADLSDALMVAWIAPQKPRIIVYIYEPKPPRLRARAVTISGSSVVASEELALILRSSILASREGGELEMAEVALPSHDATQKAQPESTNPAALASLPPRASATKSRDALGWGLYAGLTHARVISDGGGNTGLGLRAFGQSGRVRLAFGYALLPVSSLRADHAEFTVQRHPIQAQLGLQLMGEPFRILAELACLADPMQRSTRWVAEPLGAEPSSWRWGWSVAGLLRGEVHLLSGMWFSGGAGVEIALNPFSYQQIWAEDHRTLARILPVRPALDLGLVWVTR